MLQTLKNLAGGLIFDGWLFHSIIFPHSSPRGVPWCSMVPFPLELLIRSHLPAFFFTSTVYTLQRPPLNASLLYPLRRLLSLLLACSIINV